MGKKRKQKIDSHFKGKSEKIVEFPKSAAKAVTAGQVANAMQNTGNQSRNLAAMLAGGFSGAQASNHYEEALHYEGVSYVAITAICYQLHSATVTAYQDGPQQQANASRRKSLRAIRGSAYKAIYGQDEAEVNTLDSNHALMQLLAHPNPYEPGGMFRYRQALQLRLTGSVFIWNRPNAFGRTCERYVIPTVCLTPVYPSGPNGPLPYGGFRVQPNCMRWIPQDDPQGYVQGMPALSMVLGMVIDARFIQKVGLPHPIFLDDNQSPMSATAQWVDAARSVDMARASGVGRGLDPSIIVKLGAENADIDQDEMDKVQRKYDRKYGGPDNTGKALVVGNSTDVTVVGQNPKDMGYAEAHADLRGDNLAAHGTSPVFCGFQEAGAYAAYYASLKQTMHTSIKPTCDLFADADTQTIAPQFGEGITIEIEPQPINDEDELNKRITTDVAAKIIRVNEVRALRGMPPIEGPAGDKMAGQDAPQKGQAGQNPFGQQSTDGSTEGSESSAPKPPKIDQPKMPTSPFGEESESKTLKAARDGMREADDEWIEQLVESKFKALKARDPALPRKFSSTQINLPSGLTELVKAIGNLVPDDELADDGREDQIHATCLYGLHTNNVEIVRNAVSGIAPFQIILGKTSYFECDGFDVVKIDVQSVGLLMLHERIAEACEYTSTHPVYIPHVTAVYVKSGLGQKYAGLASVEGESFLAQSLVFSSQNKVKTEIELTGPKIENLIFRKSLGMSGEIGTDGGFTTIPEFAVPGLRDADNGSDPSYGSCPFCGKPGVERERRVDGNTKCESGHVYPSSASVFERMSKVKSVVKVCGWKSTLKSARWITIHGSDEGGGSHIQIDGDGNILSGPASLAKDGITHLSDFRKPRGWANHDHAARELIPAAHAYLGEQHSAWETAKVNARKVTGLTAGDIARHENAYRDHSSVHNFDTASRTVARENTELGLDPEARDTPAKVWELIREGKKRKPSISSPEVADLASKWAQGKKPTQQSAPMEHDADWDFKSLGAKPVIREPETSVIKSERWITIGEGEEGGTHIKVDGDGNIVAGPSELTDKGITNMNDFGNDQKPKGSHEPSVGDRAEEVGKRAPEIEPTKVTVQHAKGYSGKLGNRSYFAKINGTDEKYGLDREFQEPDEVDWGDSQLFKKSKGTWNHIHNVNGEGGVFEHNQHGDRDYRVYFPGIKEDKPTLFKKTLTEDELKKSLNILKGAGMNVAQLPKAMTDAQGSELSPVDRVRRWTQFHMDKEVANDFKGDVDAMKEALERHEAGSSSDWQVKEQAGYRAAIKRAIEHSPISENSTSTK